MEQEVAAPDLVESLRRYVTDWVHRVGPRIRDEMVIAKLEIVLSQPQGEDDGTLYLDYVIDETVTADRSGGRVTGQRFDPAGPQAMSRGPAGDRGTVGWMGTRSGEEP